MKKRIVIQTRSQVELLQHTPSPLFRAARYRTGAGVHAEEETRYTKRDRARNRADERRALLQRNEAE